MSYEKCPDVCKRAYWQADEVFGGGQWNCPHHYGVDYAAAAYDGEVRCKHFERKEVDE